MTTTAAVAAGDSPAEDGVLPEDATTSMGGAGGSMGGMYGGSGGMGMGSMGGMGMGGMGGMYGMYGMGMSPMMMGGGYGMGPLSWVYSLNAMVHSVGCVFWSAWYTFFPFLTSEASDPPHPSGTPSTSSA